MFQHIGDAASAIELHSALVDRDSTRAAAIGAADSIMDGLHRKLFAILLEPGPPHGTEAAVDVTLLGRFHERFADQAVNVGRRISFIIEGD